MSVVIASEPASTLPQEILNFSSTHPAINGLVIATILGVVFVLYARYIAGRAHGTRRQGPAYAFPKRQDPRDIRRALAKVSPVQAAILKYIIDGYLEGVDAAHVAQHLGIRRADAAKHLNRLHKLGLLYVKKGRGSGAVFYLIESVMTRIGEPTFFTLIGLTDLA